jgi:hypothetical protein
MGGGKLAGVLISTFSFFRRWFEMGFLSSTFRKKIERADISFFFLFFFISGLEFLVFFFFARARGSHAWIMHTTITISEGDDAPIPVLSPFHHTF